MFKLLVNAPSGAQEVVEVYQGGDYLPLEPWRKLWDEREDGVLPAITLGGMVRSGATLAFSQDRLDEHNAVVLAAGRAQAWERIKARRSARKFAGVYVAGVGKWFHTDAEESRVQQLGMKDLARDTLANGGTMETVLQKLGQSIAWKTMDGTFVPMTAQLAFDVVAAVGDLDALCHGLAEMHRVGMEAAADPLAYDFSGGWPVVYGS